MLQNNTRMKKSLFIFVALGLMFFGLQANQAHASWGYYRSFTATSSVKAIPASQSNFPALISFTNNSLKTTSTDAVNGRVQVASGTDIGVFSDSGCTSAINFEREFYSSSTGEFDAWVAQPTLNTSTVDYLCYGNSAQTADLASSTAPWGNNFTAVYHLSQKTTSTARYLLDSTKNAWNASSSGTLFPSPTSTGYIDGAQKFSGAQYARTAATSIFSDYSNTSTIIAWVKPTTTSTAQAVWSVGEVSDNNATKALGIDDAGQVGFYGNGLADTANANSGLYTPKNTWSFTAVAHSAGTSNFLVNGATSSVADTYAYAIGSDSFQIGASAQNYVVNGQFNGTIDEIEISTSSFSFNWMRTEYWNQFTPTTFWTIGSETAATTAPAFVGNASTTWIESNGSVTTAGISGVQNGDTFVAYAGCEDQANCGTLSVTSTPALTWVLQKSLIATGYAPAYIWTSTSTSATTLTVTFSNSAGGTWYKGGDVLVFHNTGGIGNSWNASGTSGVPSVSASSSAHSAIVGFDTDWAAKTGSGTWLINKGSFTKLDDYNNDASRWDTHGGYYPDTGSAGTSDIGMSAPASQKYQFVAVEVLGSAGGGGGSVPGIPGTPTYTNTSTSTLTVSWATSTSATTYNLERSTNGNSFSHVASTTDPTATYGDSGLSTSTTYYYRVSAQNSSGNSSYSASSSVTTAAAASAGIAFVQSTSTAPRTGVTSASAAFPTNNTAGNLIIASVGYWIQLGTSSISDTQGNAYTQASSIAFNNSVPPSDTDTIWYAKNIKSGPNTVTVNFANAQNGVNFHILEYSGLDTVSPLDITSHQTSTIGTNMISGTSTTHYADELIYGFGDAQGSVSAAGGLTSRETGGGDLSEDRIVSSAGNYSTPMTQDTSDVWADTMVTFKSASGSSGACGGGGGNISTSTTAHWAWNDAIGWIDFCNTGTVNVDATGLIGYASSSVGDISLDCATTRIGDICGTSNYQVTNDGSGNLSGWAWNDEYGWISFDCSNGGTGCGASSYQVVIDPDGDFSNYAWNDIVGWISFNCDQSYSGGGNTCGTSNYKVQSTWIPAGATSTSGYVDSTTYDTGVANGAQINSFLWHGDKPVGTAVRFQFAVSNSSSGPWNYVGTDGTSNTYYSTNPDVSLKLDYELFNNFRYFRYRVTLYSDAAQTLTPRVDEVIVNWSP
jgi:hypothetical protein